MNLHIFETICLKNGQVISGGKPLGNYCGAVIGNILHKDKWDGGKNVSMTFFVKFCITIFITLFFKTTQAVSDDYIIYHTKVINIEKLILANKLDSSLLDFKTLFKVFPPFAKDCYTAMQVAALLKKKEDFNEFARLGISRGLSIRKINASILCKKFIDGNNTFYELYDKERKLFFEKINFLYRIKIASLLAVDDLYKFSEEGTYKPSDNWGNIHEMVCADNGQKLIELVKIYGFPGEQNVGVQDPEIDRRTCDKCDNLHWNDFSLTVTRMFYHSPCIYFNLKSELRKALKSGGITPSEYALIYEWSHYSIRNPKKNKCGISSSDLNTIKQELNFNVHILKEMYSVDSNKVKIDRASIGLAEDTHLLAKREFEINTDFIFTWGIFNMFY